MTQHGRIEGIVDHLMAARRLAIGSGEPFLLNLIDLVLYESGTLLAAAEQQQRGAAPEFAAKRPAPARRPVLASVSPERRRRGVR